MSEEEQVSLPHPSAGRKPAGVSEGGISVEYLYPPPPTQPNG